jgi:CheY-like chemotaxis protein
MAPAAVSPLRVLVVDDEPLIAWALAETLGSKGDIVSEAANGAEAIRALANTPAPDVVLLDYGLPDTRNLELLTTVKQMAPQSRVVLMSAYYTPELAAEAFARGASRVVSKPMEMNDVPAIVHGRPS